MASRLVCCMRNAVTMIRTSRTTALLSALPRIMRQPIRSAKQQAEKLPYEMEGKVKVRTRIFTCEDDRHFKYVTLFGFAQFAFWFHLGALNLGQRQTQRIETSKSDVQIHEFWLKLTDTVERSRDKIAVATILVGVLVMFVTIVYPRRHIKFLDLMPGGERVALTTYGYLGRTRSFSVPLNEISFQQSRHHAKYQLNFKVKGHKFYYLMDQTKGEFHDPDLFDNVIGLKRKL